MLRKGANGTEILEILDTITSVDDKKETVAFAMMPSKGMILNHKGEEVVF